MGIEDKDSLNYTLLDERMFCVGIQYKDEVWQLTAVIIPMKTDTADVTNSVLCDIQGCSVHVLVCF